MNIDQFIVEQFAMGWAVKAPYEGKDRQGNSKTQYKETYHANLEQCLRYIRDHLAKGCQTTQELIAMLEQCRDIDHQILSQNGLVRSAA